MTGIPGLIAGIGFKALAGKALSNAASDAKAAGKWLGSLDVIHMLALGLAILLLLDHLFLLGADREKAKLKTQIAASAKALNTSRGNEKTLRDELAKQNAAVADLAAKSAQQQKQAAAARQASQGRVSAAQSASDRLKVSAAQRPAAGDCEPSAALKEQWQ